MTDWHWYLHDHGRHGMAISGQKVKARKCRSFPVRYDDHITGTAGIYILAASLLLACGVARSQPCQRAVNIVRWLAAILSTTLLRGRRQAMQFTLKRGRVSHDDKHSPSFTLSTSQRALGGEHPATLCTG